MSRASRSGKAPASRFERDLQALPRVYEAAVSAKLDPLSAVLGRVSRQPLCVVGSGGSFSAAVQVANLHQLVTGQVARPLTPLEFMESAESQSSFGAILISASGNNQDIINAYLLARRRIRGPVVAVCAKTGSALSKLASGSASAPAVELGMEGRDGFLATRSLLTLFIAFGRAYADLSGCPGPFSVRFQEFLQTSASLASLIKATDEEMEPLWERTDLHLLYSPTLSAVASDLESKFTEAAIIAALPADFRNFGHGRHNWAAKRSTVSAVLALHTNGYRELARTTLDLLPSSIPRVERSFEGSTALAATRALVDGLFIVHSAATARGIDPNRPSVPAFGRKLYHLRKYPRHLSRKLTPRNDREHHLFLKTGASPLPTQREAAALFLDSFVLNLTTRNIGAIVLDFDGTIIETSNRFGSIRPEIVRELERLVRCGLKVAIATGRGSSCLRQLRQALSADLWPEVQVACHNGASIIRLDKDLLDAGGPDPFFCEVAEALREQTGGPEELNIRIKRSQLSVHCSLSTDGVRLWELVNHLVSTRSSRYRVVMSSHSVDVIPADVSKRAILDRLLSQIDPELAVLSIGDRGRWPGNDFDLLAHSLSLSVDDVSPDLTTCWNLAPPHWRNTAATQYYLKCLRPGAARGRVFFHARLGADDVQNRLS